MRFIFSIIFLLHFIQVFSAEVQVAVASNFTAPMEKIIQAFTAENGHKVLASYGSTGKLYTQIVNGAPFEIFLCADQIHAKKLIEEKKALGQSVFTYAIGKLVLWSPKAKVVDDKGEVLGKMNYKHISLANPKFAPYGEAAKQVLEKNNLWQKLQSKIVLGENINQAYQFVESGNAQLGFVAYSQILQEGATRGSYWLIPQQLYSPIKQDAVLLNKGNDSNAAKEFMKFLKGQKAKNIIKTFGYEFD